MKTKRTKIERAFLVRIHDVATGKIVRSFGFCDEITQMEVKLTLGRFFHEFKISDQYCLTTAHKSDDKSVKIALKKIGKLIADNEVRAALIAELSKKAA